MNQKNKKNFSHWLFVIVIGVALGFAIQFVKAWTEPTQAPPGGNVGAPINTSATTQTKLGKINVLDVCLKDDLTKCLSTAGTTMTICNNNGVCDASSGENYANCPDCSAPSSAPVCNNNGVCEGGENLSNCASDCCECSYPTTRCGQTTGVFHNCCVGAASDTYLCTYPGTWVLIDSQQCWSCG